MLVVSVDRLGVEGVEGAAGEGRGVVETFEMRMVFGYLQLQ